MPLGFLENELARRKQNAVEGLIKSSSKLPWWAGVVLAVAAYFWLHGLATREVAVVAEPGKMGDFVSQNPLIVLATVGQYLLPCVFLIGAALSAYGCYKRRALHEPMATSPDRGALNSMSWKQFEAVVGEAFRRRGYTVAQAGRGGADGGFDLELKKKDQAFLVQCKQWRAIKVGVNTVRELQGAMVARGATGGFVVTSGVFTDEARTFARDKHVELMDGKALHSLIRGVSLPSRIFRDPLSVVTTGSPFCPECQSRMVMRHVKRGEHAGKAFWRCSRHPECKGKRPA